MHLTRLTRPAWLLAAVLVLPQLLTPASAAAVRTQDVGAHAATQVTALLSLAQDPVARVRLHALAGRPGRHSVASLAPRPAHRAAVLAWARDEGLRVDHADAWTVTVTGPRQAIAAARTELGGHVSSVLGLDPRRLHEPRATADGTDNPQTPASLRSAYDVPAADRGAGVTVGVLALAGWEKNDLATFATEQGSPLTAGQLTEVNVGLAPTKLDGLGGEFEVALDSEAVLAMAPDARQRLYFAPNSEEGIVGGLSQMATDAEHGLIQVSSTSWGICEALFRAGSADLQSAYAAAIDRLVASGATLFAAAGDGGAFDCSTPDEPDNSAQVDWPASYVNTVAVGGTTLNPGGPEIAWHDTGFGYYLGDGGGGGESLDEPLPSYQAGLVAGARQRLVPDVAADADPQSGMGIYVRTAGGDTGGGGTSLAAPLWAGMLASALSSAGRTTGLGNVLPALYASAADAAGPGFTDVTAGHNNLWHATTGYDKTTGLGVPRWSVLAPALLAATPAGPADGTPDTTSPRRPPLPDPAFRSSPRWVRTTSVPVVVTAAPSYSGFSAGETVQGCAELSPDPPTQTVLDPDPYQGEHLLTLTALDPSLTCHVVLTSVFYDTVAPVTTVSAALLTTADTRVVLTFGGTDAVSGIAAWHVIVQTAEGETVLTTDSTSYQLVTKLQPGRTYVVQATARDRAGNVGAPRTTSITLPVDDTRSRGPGRGGGRHAPGTTRAATCAPRQRGAPPGTP